MLNTLRTAFTAMPALRASPVASSSRQHLPSLQPSFRPIFGQQVRFRSELAPRRFRTLRAHKGLPIHLPTGGSIRGTTLKEGQYGLRILQSVRLSAQLLSSCMEALKRKTRPIKGCRVFLRTFPNVPVCVKGNETRMGKGKGSFEFWAARVSAGRVIFEIRGGGMQSEVAKAALALVQRRLPVKSEFITSASPARLGSIANHDLQSAVQRIPAPGAFTSLAERKAGFPGAAKVMSKSGGAVTAIKTQAGGVTTAGQVVGAEAAV